MRSIVLVGFMGTGKTAVGISLAERMHMTFVDVDALIEQKCGMSIRDIFRKCGEPYFRKIEGEVIAGLSQGEGLVVAAGGGAVLDSRNVTRLKQMGCMIHLSAGPDVISDRTKNEHHRPLLETGDRESQIERLLAARRPLYAVADYEIDTSHLTIEDVVEKIVTYLQELFDGYHMGERP